MKSDTIKLEFLDDGTIKAITDPVSAANHVSADNFFKVLRQKAGGSVERTKRGKVQAHVHVHEGEHVHHEH